VVRYEHVSAAGHLSCSGATVAQRQRRRAETCEERRLIAEVVTVDRRAEVRAGRESGRIPDGGRRIVRHSGERACHAGSAHADWWISLRVRRRRGEEYETCDRADASEPRERATGSEQAGEASSERRCRGARRGEAPRP